MKYFIWIVILAVVVGGAAVWWNSKERSAAANSATVQQTEKVTRQTLEKVITANGKVASNRDVDIKCQASGKVIKLPYDISDQVKSGDLLLELDPVDQQRSLDQAKAQEQASTARLEQAKINFEVAKLNLETTTKRTQAEVASARARATDAKAKAQRTQELFNNNLASKEELETVQTTLTQAEAAVQTSEAALAELKQQEIQLQTRQQDIKTAEAQLTQDKAKRELAERQLEYTKVFVPDDDISKAADFRVAAIGTTTAPVQIGSIVQSGSSGFSGGTTVMTLSDVSHMFVLASVDESDIGQVADPNRGGERQKSRITVDAYPGVQFDGEVVRVATKGVNATNVVTFEVKIEVTSPNRQLLRPEMTATARIIVASRPDVLTIPVGAFVRATPGERRSDNAADTMPAGSPDAGTPAAAGGDAQGPATTAPAGRRGGGRGGFGGRGGTGRRGMGGGGVPGTPVEGTVQVVKGENQNETRNVTVGLTDDVNYEVIRGLEEGETVVVQKTGAESRWRNPNQGNLIPRGMGGGGRGR
jgi:multidrug efflux pump subunit AcrA (membrane-fusion protein)